MAVGDVYRLTVVAGVSFREQRVINQLHFKQLDGLVFDTPGEDLVQRWQGQVQSAYAALFTNLITILSYKVAKAPLFETEYELTGVNVTGGLTGEPLPAVTSGIISLYTATLNRRGRGRIYLFTPNEAASQGNGPTSGWLANAATFNTNVFGMADTNVNYARWQLHMWSVADQTAREVTRMITRTVWGTQRDRRFVF